MNEYNQTHESRATRQLLLVDDSGYQAEAIARMVRESGGWEVNTCRTPESVFSLIEQAFQKRSMPSIVSVDLGFPPRSNDATIGLELLKGLASRWKRLPLVVHSSLAPSENVVRRVMAAGASYIYIRDLSETRTYVDMLPYIAQGYKIYSPQPAAMISGVIATRPDPFDGKDIYWETLRLLAEGLNYPQIAERLGVSVRAIQERVKKAAFALDLREKDEALFTDEDDSIDKYKSLVTRWYRENHIRYGR